LLTLVTLIGFPILLSYIFANFSKLPIASFIPTSYFLSTIWLFFFGVADQLRLGQITFFPFVVTVFLVCLIKVQDFIRKEKLIKAASPAVVVFSTVAVWMFKHSQHMRFKEWDEFSHWGPAVKSMYLFDKIGPFSPAQLVFPEYPPGLSLFSYYINRIGGAWDEADVYWAYQLLVLSLIVGVLSKLTWKNKPAVILAFLLMALTAVFYFGAFQTVYADPLLALIFGFSLFQASAKEFSSNKWHLFSFSVTLFMLSITKDIGIFLAAISVLVAVVSNGVTKFELKFNLLRHIAEIVKISAISFVPIVIGKFFWKNALEKFDIKPGRDFFQILQDLITGKSSGLKQPYWNDVVHNFYSKTFDQSVTSMNGFPISAIKWIVIYSALMLIMTLAAKGAIEKLRSAGISLVLILGFFGYLGILLILYLTSFSQAEAVGLASYDRYVTTYLAGIAFFIGAIAIGSIDDLTTLNTTPPLTFLWVLLLFLQSSPWNLMSYVASPNAASDAMRSQFDAEKQMIADMELTVDDQVWFIAQHTVGFEFYLFQYELLPASVGRSPWTIGSPYGPGDIWTDTNLTKDKWNERLNDFDYVFIHSVTDSFVSEFGTLFEDPSSLIKPGFYKVQHEKTGNLMIKVR
jgi:hypothetical protein